MTIQIGRVTVRTRATVRVAFIFLKETMTVIMSDPQINFKIIVYSRLK